MNTRIEVLSRKFDEISDKREDLKDKIDTCEGKIDKILDILTGKFGSEAVKTNESVIVKPIIKKDEKEIPNALPERVLSPSNVNALTDVELPYKIPNRILSQKSRIPSYPKSNITRKQVADNKVPWSVQWPGYEPVEYTSKAVLNNSNADNNLLA
jgi:hypothetical protein